MTSRQARGKAAEIVAAAAIPEPTHDHKQRLFVNAGNRNPVDIADDIAAYLLVQNTPPRLFSMGDSAVELDGAQLVPLDRDKWEYYVARRITFRLTAAGGSVRIAAPPPAAMKLVPSIMLPQLPPIDGIATTPYLDRDGRVVAGDGYHPATRLVLHCGDFELPAVPEVPSAEDVAQAAKLLTEDWLGDFPFKTAADKANALAILLTLTGRMFFQLAPLFVVDASTAGSGKGLLVTTISLIATGQPPQVMELPADGEEQRKKITSAVLGGQELIMWDESHTISGRTLAAILTAETYSDRLLGGNKMISVRNRFTQVALGNNVEVWGDMKRRVVPARLVPDTDHPEHRGDFRHPNLDQWVKASRGELLAAVLTIWRNWIAAGRPDAPAGMGSFERWARTVGGALDAAGVTGFRSNTSTWLSYSEDDDGGWTDHLAQLHTRFGDQWFNITSVADSVTSSYLKRPPVKSDPDKTLAQQLPYYYRKIRERWHGEYRLIRSDRRDSAAGSYTWSVRRRQAASGSPVSPASPEQGADPQVSAPTGDAQPLLEMSSGPVSPVDPAGGISAGHRPSTGDTGDPGDANHDPAAHGWPEDSYGAAANR